MGGGRSDRPSPPSGAPAPHGPGTTRTPTGQPPARRARARTAQPTFPTRSRRTLP
ncbi:hypothetical protein SFR_0189 [Streptomyces sp. FR-008]|nr:hypothetical protein SFR_0189 [Streptomyces sp. FR-008]